MRWLVAVALIALLATMVVTITVAHFATGSESVLAGPPRASMPTTSTPIREPGGPTDAAPSPGSPTARTYTLAQISEHRSPTSCWLLISGLVYDVTTYLASHPGGARTILPWCGEESTEAFATEDGRGEHSPRAYDDLKPYLIGALAR